MLLGTDEIELKSYQIPENEVRSNGCFITLDVKRAVHEDLCDDALRHLKQDLAEHLYENSANIPASTENDIAGNFVAIAIPDCIPSRLGLLTRFVSLAFLHDDANSAGTSSLKANKSLNDRFTGGLAEALPTFDATQQASLRHVNPPTNRNRRRRIVENVIYPIINELLTQDHSMGLEVLDAWRKHYNNLTLKVPSGTSSATNLADHLRNCVQIFPSASWSITLRYALGLHLDETELSLLVPVLDSAVRCIVLTTDYWSWPKDAQNVDNNKRLANAVAVSMAERCCSATEALEVVKVAATAAESEFVKCKKAVIQIVGEGQSEVVMFLEALEQFVAGSSLWCSTCPRLRVRR